jgi:hypothetical protein
MSGCNSGVELVWTGSAGSYPLPYFIQTPSATKDKGEFKYGYRIIDIKSGKAYPYPHTKTGAHPNVQGSLKCPAHLHAYDSQGRHTGLNASGGVETNIPDSFYIGRYNYSDPNETETILLYNTTEEYRFEIVANLTEEEKASPEIESFNLTVEQQTDDTRTTIAHLSVPLTENTTATLPINLTTTAYTMEIDYDGDGATDETEDPDFTVTNYAPTAAIIAPETGLIYNVSEPVEFNGTGRDPEDGILTNFSLVWYSDINGVIGAGERFSTANLSCGAHRITRMVNDSVDLVDTVSVMITVVDLAPPSSITNPHPTAGTTYLNWTWTNPPDPDFNHTEIYLNGSFQTITSAEFFNATGLAPETSYTISTRTVDTAGNINQTWMNDTATTMPAPPSAASTSATGAPKDAYRVHHNVYAAGSGFTPGTNVDIYVVPDRDWNDGDSIPADVTASVETVSVNGDIAPVLVWHAPLTPGSYDIVIDANQNGFYNAATDGLDSGSPGFVVLASPPPTPPTDVPALTPHGIIALVGLLCVIGVSRIGKRFS